MANHLLPEAFADLEGFANGWALATETERSRKRQTSAMTEIQAFYDALLPRMDAIFAYLNQFPLEAMPGDAQRLLHLTLSLAEVAPAVELFKQPSVVDGYDIARGIPGHERGAESGLRERGGK
ncbi:MAG: hypothetical protein ACRERD_32525 [Candidatus Binatia bacterium]